MEVFQRLLEETWDGHCDLYTTRRISCGSIPMRPISPDRLDLAGQSHPLNSYVRDVGAVQLLKYTSCRCRDVAMRLRLFRSSKVSSRGTQGWATPAGHVLATQAATSPQAWIAEVRLEAAIGNYTPRQHNMRWLFSLLLLGLLGLASAVSTAGNRLLVVLEDLAEKGKYGVFFGDLKGTFGTTSVN